MSEQAINDSVWKLLGFRKPKKASAYDVISAIRTGLPAQSVQVFSDAVDLSLKELSTYIHVSSKTLERRLKDNVALNVDASDRLVEMAKVFARASEVIGDKEHARKWLFKPSRVLGDVKPVSLLDTSSGVEIVMDELGRIEHGIVV